MSTKPSAPLPQQHGPASTIASKSAWASGPPRSTSTLTVPSSLPTSAAVSSSPTGPFHASSLQALPPAPVTHSSQPQPAKSSKDQSSRRTARVASPNLPTATLSGHSSSPHSKSKGRINTLDGPVELSGEASPDRLSMLHPAYKKEKETGLVPICSSSLETPLPDAGECELTSILESLPSSNGIMYPITQDSTYPTPSISTARGATATPLTLSTGGGTLTADAPAFVPRRTVVIKNTSGEEVDLRNLRLPTSSSAASDSSSTVPMTAPAPKATDGEEEKQRRRQLAIMEVRRRAEEEARKKSGKGETMTIVKAKAGEEEKAGREEEEVKSEEKARRQTEADTEKEALIKRIQEQETELALLRAKLAAQSQPLQLMQPVAAPPLQVSGDHGQLMSSTDDTCSVIYSENAVQHDEPEAEGEESRGEKEKEKHHDWSADHPPENELSYFPTTGDPLTASAATFSAQQQQQQQQPQVPGQPLQKMTRERSRRGGRRDRNRAAHADKGEKGDDATNPLMLQKSRSHEPRTRAAPVPLEFSTMQRSRTLHPTLPNVLSSAKNITDIAIVVYPAGVQTPKRELNVQSRNGPFRYDREFLLQFMSVCKQKPHDMADITEIGLEPEEQPQRTPSKRGSRRSRRSTTNTPATPSTPSIEDTLASPTPSTDNDANPNLSISPATPTVIPIALSRTSSRGARSRRSSAAPKLSPVDTLTPPIPITRSASHGSRATPVSAAPLLSPLDRRSMSLKPRRRGESTGQGAPPVPSIPNDISSMIPLSAGHDIKPLETSANRWIPSSIANRGHHSRGTARSGVSVQEVEPPETIERKLKALLNKLTMEKFDSISHQIVAWANKSETEVDGATLQLVIKLVFEKATDEATWSHMYARLCRKMMEHVSSDVKDENVKDKHGNFVAGGQLFRQYLLSRCQADFERGWSAREDLEEKQEAVVAASGAAPGEIVFSDEYYALQKAKRRGLGLVKFIGELFKLQMLTERIMHRCIERLLYEPAEEDIESACQLLITVGSALSGPKGKVTMDGSFEKMKGLLADCSVSSRIRFMLQDVIELRARDWIPRNQTAAPTTLAEVHEAAAKEKEIASRPIPLSRNSSRRGNNRGGDNPRESTADGWSSARSLGRAAASTLSINSILSPPKDDKNLSRTPRSASSSMFHSLARNPSDSGSSRTPHTLTRHTSESGSTRHTMARNPSDSGLSRASHSMNRNPSESGSSRNTHAIARVPSESGLTRMARNPSEPGKSRTGSRRDLNRRRPSTDFDQLNAVADSGSVGRRKLQLLPRSVGVPIASSVDPTEDFALGVTVEEPEPLPSMSETQAMARVEEDVKELFQIHDLTEGIAYFETLPGEYRHLLVDKLISKVDTKEFDVAFMEKLFARVVDAGACDEEIFERGFASTMTFLDDISVDVPTAYAVIARLLLAAKLSRGAIERLANSITGGGNRPVRPSETLWEQYSMLRQEKND